MTDATQKKGFLGFLKTVGLVEETPEPTPSEGDRGSAAQASVTEGPAPHSPSDGEAPDPEVLAKLEKRLQASCPAPYVTFTEQYEALREIIPDEATRFRAALKTSRASAEQVTGALDHLLEVMEAARAEFSHSFEENKGRRLGEAQASIKATEDLIASNERQLKAIEETIASLRTKRGADAEAMRHEERRLLGIREAFDTAHAHVTHRLLAQKSRVASMPKG